APPSASITSSYTRRRSSSTVTTSRHSLPSIDVSVTRSTPPSLWAGSIRRRRARCSPRIVSRSRAFMPQDAPPADCRAGARATAPACPSPIRLSSDVRLACRRLAQGAEGVAELHAGLVMTALLHEPQELSQLLLLLYEGALDPGRWREFLELVGRRLKANYETLVLRSPAFGESGLLYNWGAQPEGTAAYTGRYFALDPFVGLPEGQVVTLHEFVGKERLEQSEFYREYMQPVDSIYNLGVDLREPGRYYVRFRVCRSGRTGEFG